MACMCGDPLCPSCGPAQGFALNGSWADTQPTAAEACTDIGSDSPRVPRHMPEGFAVALLFASVVVGLAGGALILLFR